MAVAGQRPKPAVLKFLEGNRGHKPIKPEYKPAPLMPPMPNWLSDVAKTEWKRAGKLLFDVGLLHREDHAAFECYCENYATVVKCSNFINKHGGVAQYTMWWYTKAVLPGPPRHIDLREKAMTQVRMFCAEFGLSPAARGRIEVPDAPDMGDEDLD
jgi:P27 family predicted phage terminase small subunit